MTPPTYRTIPPGYSFLTGGAAYAVISLQLLHIDLIADLLILSFYSGFSCAEGLYS